MRQVVAVLAAAVATLGGFVGGPAATPRVARPPLTAAVQSGAPLSRAAAAGSVAQTPKAHESLIVDPFPWQFGLPSFDEVSSVLHAEFFTPHVLLNRGETSPPVVTIDSLRSGLAAAAGGVIVIASHGGLANDSRQPPLPVMTIYSYYTQSAAEREYRDLVSTHPFGLNASDVYYGPLEPGQPHPWVVGLTGAGMDKILPPLDGAFVDLDVCHSGESPALADAFLAHGARQVLSWAGCTNPHATDVFFAALAGGTSPPPPLGVDRSTTGAAAVCRRDGCKGTPVLTPPDSPVTLAPAVQATTPAPGDLVALGRPAQIHVAFDTAIGTDEADRVLSVSGCGATRPTHQEWAASEGGGSTEYSATVTPTKPGVLTLTVNPGAASSAAGGFVLDGNRNGRDSDYGAQADKDGPYPGASKYAWRILCGAPVITSVSYKVTAATATWTDDNPPTGCSGTTTGTFDWSADITGLSTTLPTAVSFPDFTAPPLTWQSGGGYGSPQKAGTAGSAGGAATWEGQGSDRPGCPKPPGGQMVLNGQVPGPALSFGLEYVDGKPEWLLDVAFATSEIWANDNAHHTGVLPLPGACVRPDGGQPCAYDAFSVSEVKLAASGNFGHEATLTYQVGPYIPSIDQPDKTNGGGSFTQSYSGTVTVTGYGIASP